MTKRRRAEIRRQELWCHNCERYVQFDIDHSLDGNHILNCPNCGHEHCRVVRNGEITGDRWDSRNGGVTHYATAATYSTASFQSTSSSSAYSGSTTYLTDLWASVASGTSTGSNW